tara:strand:- start:184 stop:585 length:402 start_codon:yes stop_codon:yes gene_type:complete
MYYSLYAAPSEQSTKMPSYDDKAVTVFSLYQQVRDLRESLLVDSFNQDSLADLLILFTQIIQQASDEWLLLFEAVELIDSLNKAEDFLTQREKLYGALVTIGECAGKDTVDGKKVDQEKQALIGYAISRLSMR